MPYVLIQLLEGVSHEQKARVIHDVTNSLMTRLGKQPEHIHVVIQEVPEQNWGFAGLPTNEWKKRESERST